MVQYKPRYRYLFLAGFLYAFHYALTLYINSSFLGDLFSEQAVNRFYTAGSIITLIALIISSRVLKRFGNYALVLVGIIAEVVSILTLAFSDNLITIGIAFMAHEALPPLIFFGLDIFFEGTLVSNNDAEKIRPYYLTSLNIAFVFAPLIVASLVSGNSFKIVYILSAVLALILWFVIADVFKGVNPKKYREIGFTDSLRKFLKRKNLSGIFVLNFLLQFFYAIMIIYTGPYLHETMGLPWSSIGIIFTIMLVPFVLFQAPLGKLFERYHDERDVLVAGFIIMAGALFLISRTTSSSIIVWASLLFLSRIGASFVEASSEAAFFKRMTDQDAGFIGIFRMAFPLALVIAPLIASFFLGFVTVQFLYFILGIIMLTGVACAYKTLKKSA